MNRGKYRRYLLLPRIFNRFGAASGIDLRLIGGAQQCKSADVTQHFFGAHLIRERCNNYVDRTLEQITLMLHSNAHI
jgi:hypothetical protein